MESTKKSNTDSNALIMKMRILQEDHEPDGWPAVQMKEITNLCNYTNELEQQKTASEDMLVAQINSMVNQLDRAEARVKELEQAEPGVLMEKIAELEQQLEELKQYDVRTYTHHCDCSGYADEMEQRNKELEQQLANSKLLS